MNKPVPSDDYGHGQMMGMLVIIEMFNKIRDDGGSISGATLDRIKRIAVEDLSIYLNKPEEDVILLVTEQLRNI